MELILTNINNHRGDTKYVYKLVAKLTGTKAENPLPDAQHDIELAESFAAFFVGKIQKIHDNLKHHLLYEPTRNNQVEHFKDFFELSESQAKALVKLMQTKSCELDLIPTYILKITWIYLLVLLPKL